ncbi:methyltransferase domain-containing protein [Paenibacillus sp. MMS20-IR301]|uniref:methyltransferase domain-containing protein n=1 Tax=Paenibacillus sp. MMS20-IR301 TaxID=2895946 RepID=UPI0028E64E74|nr:methyltransferase domain-containing protein [Paenibacillus sp. MMS20-IR301]WNS46709.1 methyltransferase domain-containing protein [Paenibacillus sp. MMS20-IR301]
MTILLFDPMKHPDWVTPQTPEWHANLALESGGYKYPWKSVFDEPCAEVIFTEKISSVLHENAKVLDVGCGHGEFTKTFAHTAKEVMGIDADEGYIALANEGASASVKFLVVDANKPLPFSNDSFDVIYTKKGPWLFHKGMTEGHRILKPGGIALGLYHCGTDGGLRSLFPGLYSPLPDSYLGDLTAKYERQMSDSNLERIELQIFDEVEYLSTPEDVLIKKCFGQKESLKKTVWQECLEDVEEIFNQHATSRGLRVVNYHALMIGRA